MPYSMIALSEQLHTLPNVKVVEYFQDYSFGGSLKGILSMIRFMPLYARAAYVFICDCYIPVSSCKKRKGTTVVQLWHSCGLLKKVGADSPQDRKLMMKEHHKNYDVFTTSARCVSEELASALNIPLSSFTDTGVSRTDLYYQQDRTDSIRCRFLKSHPEYQGKKILLWVPTFRGTAHTSFVEGQAEILRLKEELPEDCALIIRTHRFVRHLGLDTPLSFTSEELLTVADVLITDYSSIYFDYLYFRRPVILFAPDLNEYLNSTGLYPDYKSLPGKIAKNYSELLDAVLTVDQWADADYRRRMDALWETQMTYCDGNCTQKLLKRIGLLSEEPADTP